MTATLSLVAAAFMFGVFVGAFGKAALQGRRRSGHTEGMPPDTHVAGGRLSRPRLLGMIAVSVALLLSAASTLLVMLNGNSLEDSVECSVDYRVADGLARDERAVVSAADLNAEIDAWRAIRAQVEAGEVGTPEERRDQFLETITARIKALRDVKTSRLVHPYPKPDACADGAFEPDDYVNPKDETP